MEAGGDHDNDRQQRKPRACRRGAADHDDNDRQQRKPRAPRRGGTGKSRKRTRWNSSKSPEMNHSTQLKDRNKNGAFEGFVDVPEQRTLSEQKTKPHTRSQGHAQQHQGHSNVDSTQHQGHRRRRKSNRNESACKQTLQWQTIHPRVPLQSEKRILNTLIRYKKKERGMIRNAGDRYKEIRKKCNQVGMQLSQALSLRRQHMHHLNPYTRMPSLGLGKEEDIRQSAALFESAVEDYMNQCNIRFLTEAQQKAAVPEGTKQPPTPDFMLQEPTLLSTAIPLHPGQEPQVQEFVIHWVEAKMFYGASSIAKGSNSAVGRILATSEKYVKLYGTGAMVFMYGCGKEVAEWLLQRGVVALDAHPLDLRHVEKYQRTWCANKSGLILP